MILNFDKLSSRAAEETNATSQVPFAEQQLQILQIYNNLNFCLRTEDQNLQETSETFNPLDNLDLYKNPDLVKTFFENVTAGYFGSRLEPFYFSDIFKDEVVQFFNIIWPIDDWNLLYNTTAYASQRMNTQAFLWSVSCLLATKYRYLKTPPSYEVFPQLYTPKLIVKEANEMDRGNIVDHPDTEDILTYWRGDPGLNQFHFNWHTNFPYWLSSDQDGLWKERRGELFMYMHHNLVSRYKAERLSNGMLDTAALAIDKPIIDGNIPMTLNVDLTELPTREPNLFLQDVSGITLQDLKDWENRIAQAIQDGYFINNQGNQVTLRNNSGNDYLGNTVESAEPSINMDYYGSLHNSLHFIISVIGNPNNSSNLGIMAHPEQSIQDAGFFRIHYYVDVINQDEQYKLPPYTKKDLQFSSVNILSVRIGGKYAFPLLGVPVLKTFMEDFTYEITNAIKSCSKVNSGERFNATVNRLNYQPFDYKINAISYKVGDTRGIVRIYMSPVNGFDGKPFSRQDLFWNMFEMDRFPVTLKFGSNMIGRSSLKSSVTIPTPPGFYDLREAVQKAVSENGKEEPYPINTTRLCGWPNNLLLPRGTKEGMKFKMFVIITPASTGDYDENEYPQLPWCGNPSGKYPDGVPMGFPFNRRFANEFLFPWGIVENYKLIDLIVKHEDNVEQA